MIAQRAQAIEAAPPTLLSPLSQPLPSCVRTSVPRPWQTYVYGDLYRFQAEKKEWRLVGSPNSPPPRSGHQGVAWKNFLFIFGACTARPAPGLGEARCTLLT